MRCDAVRCGWLLTVPLLTVSLLTVSLLTVSLSMRCGAVRCGAHVKVLEIGENLKVLMSEERMAVLTKEIDEWAAKKAEEDSMEVCMYVRSTYDTPSSSLVCTGIGFDAPLIGWAQSCTGGYDVRTRTHKGRARWGQRGGGDSPDFTSCTGRVACTTVSREMLARVLSVERRRSEPLEGKHPNGLSAHARLPCNVGVPPFVRISAKFCSLLWPVQSWLKCTSSSLPSTSAPLCCLVPRSNRTKNSRTVPSTVPSTVPPTVAQSKLRRVREYEAEDLELRRATASGLWNKQMHPDATMDTEEKVEIRKLTDALKGQVRRSEARTRPCVGRAQRPFGACVSFDGETWFLGVVCCLLS